MSTHYFWSCPQTRRWRAAMALPWLAMYEPAFGDDPSDLSAALVHYFNAPCDP